MSEEIHVSEEVKSCTDKIMAILIIHRGYSSVGLAGKICTQVQLLLNQQIQLACLNWRHRDAALQTKIAALEAEVGQLRIENSELSRKVGFLGGVIQGVTHWNIPPELKIKLEGEVLKMTTALNSTKGEK